MGSPVRNVIRPVLIGLGVFFLLLTFLLRFWAPGQAKKTPLDTDAVSIATGPAKIYNSTTGKVEDFELRATRTLKADSAASDKKNVVFLETLCIVKVIGDTPNCVSDQDSQGRLLSFTTDRVVDDRKSAEAVNDPKYREDINGDTSVQHKGLSYKWPFDAKKKTYKFWDNNARQAADAVYQGTDKIAGLTTYHYTETIEGASVEQIPGLTVGYSDTRDVWVDPTTGVIVKGIERQLRTLPDGTTALDTTLTFTDDTIKSQADLAKDGRKKLQLLTVTIPAICILLAIAAIVGAVYFKPRRGGPDGPIEDTVPRRDPAHSR